MFITIVPFICLLTLYATTDALPNIPIRIIPSNEEEMPTEPTKTYRSPENVAGPLSEMGPTMSCISNSTNIAGEQHEIKICLFQNVTGLFNGTTYVAGIWNGWEIEDGYYRNMIFTDGDECGNGTMSSRLELVSTEGKRLQEDGISSIYKSSECVYHIRVHLSIPRSTFEATEGINSPGVIGYAPYRRREELEDSEDQMHHQGGDDDQLPPQFCDLTSLHHYADSLQAQVSNLREEIASISNSSAVSQGFTDELSRAMHIYRSCISVVQMVAGMVEQVAGVLEFNQYQDIKKKEGISAEEVK